MTAMPRFGQVLAVMALLVPPLALYANKGVAPLVLLAGAFAAYRLGRERRLAAAAATPLFGFPAVMVVWASLSALWAAAPGASALAALAVGAMLFAVILVVAAAAEEPGPEPQLAPALAFGLCLGVAGAWDHSQGQWLARLAHSVAAIPLDTRPSRANAGLVALTLLFWPAAIAWWRRGPRPVVALLAALVGVTVLAGSSITAKLALPAMAVGFAAVAAGGRRAAQAVAALCVLAVLFAPLAAAWSPSPEQFGRWVDPESHSGTSGAHRLLIWQFVAARIGERPWFGWGMDASRSLPGGRQIVIADVGEALPLHPHNAALQIWLELGLVGAILFAAIVAVAGRAVWRIEGDWFARAAASAALAGAMVVLASSWGVWQKWWLGLLGVAAALLVAVCRGRAPS